MQAQSGPHSGRLGQQRLAQPAPAPRLAPAAGPHCWPPRPAAVAPRRPARCPFFHSTSENSCSPRVSPGEYSLVIGSHTSPRKCESSPLPPAGPPAVDDSYKCDKWEAPCPQQWMADSAAAAGRRPAVGTALAAAAAALALLRRGRPLRRHT